VVWRPRYRCVWVGARGARTTYVNALNPMGVCVCAIFEPFFSVFSQCFRTVFATFSTRHIHGYGGCYAAFLVAKRPPTPGGKNHSKHILLLYMNPRFLFHSSTAHLQCLPAPKNCPPEHSAPPLSTQQQHTHTHTHTHGNAFRIRRQSGGGFARG
jgi:hypothetical protein